MRRINILIIIFLGIQMTGFSQVGKIHLNPLKQSKWISSKTEGTISLTYKLDSLQLTDIDTKGARFQRISASGLYSDGEIGSPELPVYKKLIEIPEGSDVDVQILSYSTKVYKMEDFGFEEQIFPAQPSRSKGQPDDSISFVIDKKAFQRNSYGDKPIAGIEILGTLRGIRIARLTIAPLKYNPAQGILKVYNDIELKIVFKNPDNLKSKQAKSNFLSPLFNPLLSQVKLLDDYPEHPDLTKYPVKYLIVAPDSFRDGLKPFVDWKTQQGFQIVQGYTSTVGTTTTEIQTWVHSQYNNATGVGSDQKPTYILIVGDIQQIPAFVGSRTGLYTDLYYASVDGDYFPEMYYGRFSVTNTGQLAAIVEKTLYYEKYLFEQPEYLDKVTLIAGADGTYNPTHGRPTVRYARDNYFNTANGFDTVYFYESTYTGCYATIDTGIGFINYTAHGSTGSWANPDFTSTNVGSLTNTNMYPLAIGNCCLSANFGVSECFGEKWIRVSQKGGVVYIGSAPNSYWDEDVFWSVGAFPFVGNGVTPLYEETTTGAYDAPFTGDYVSAGALMFVGNLAVTEADVQNYPGESSPEYYWQGYNLLGDPSLMPYFKQGLVNSVSYLEYFPKGTNWFEVSALPGSYVGISSDTILLGAAFVDSIGGINVPVIDTIDVSSVTITVTRQQYQPYISTIPAIYPEGPYIHLKTAEIDDTLGGNANAQAEYEEEIYFDVTVKNLGKQPVAGDVEVSITTSDPYIMVLDSMENFGFIDTTDGLDIIHKENDFSYEITNYLPDQHKAVFQYKATDGDSIWMSDFAITLHSPVLKYLDYIINDSAYGNMDGVLDPGEQATLIVEVENSGHSGLDNIVISLTDNDPYITLSETKDSIIFIEKGETIEAVFEVSVSYDVPGNYSCYIPVNLTGGGDDQYICKDTFQLNINCDPVYKMSNGSISACRGWFYDSGGETGNYTNNENLVFTIHPCYQGQAVALEFFEINVESGYDYLYIYNGTGTGAPQLAGSPFTSTNSPGYIVADNPDGSLTFRFYSDGADVRSGWRAFIHCIDPTIIPECTSLVYPSNDTLDIMPIVDLLWEYSPGALQYHVYFDTTNTSMSFYDSTSFNKLRIAETLEPYTTYYWKVVPFNHAGAPASCESWSYTTGPDVYLHTTDTLVLCGGFYFDSGGLDNNYSNNENQTLVIFPSEKGYRISLNFLEFATESGYDNLYICDSSNTSGPQVTGSPFSGTNSPGMVTGYNQEGALALRFVSDGSDTESGWKATIRCKPVVLSVVASASSLSIFRGDTIQLLAVADGGYEPYTYEWFSFPFDSSLKDTSIAFPYICPKEDTKYWVDVSDGDTVVSDTVLIEAREYVPHSVVVFSSADTVMRGTLVQLSSLVTGGSENYSYLWEAYPFDSSMTDSTQPNIQVYPGLSTEYTLYVDDHYTVQDSSITVVVLEPSLIITSLDGNEDICLGDTAELSLSVTGNRGSIHYLWESEPRDISMKDTINQEVTMTPSENTLYRVTISDRFETISDSVNIVVHSFPDPLIISIDADSAIESNYDGQHLWYINDTLIPGSNGNTLKPPATGIYYAIAYAAECFSGPSNKIYFQYTGNQGYNYSTTGVQIHPNPFNDYCVISVSHTNGAENIKRVEIYGITGSRIDVYDNINANSFLLYKGNLDPGVYMLRILGSDMNYQKVIIY